MPRRTTIAAAAPALVTATATAAGAPLTIALGDVPADATISIVGTTVTVSGVPGVSDGTAYPGVDDLTVTGGDAEQSVDVTLDLAGDLALAINTGDRNSIVSVTGDVDAGSADIDVDIDCGRGSHLITVDLGADASTLSVLVDITTGDGGGSTITALVDSGPMSADLDVSFVLDLGRGPDTVDLVVDSTAMNPALILDAYTNKGNDDLDVTFRQHYPSSVDAIIVANTAHGADSFGFEFDGAEALADLTAIGEVIGGNGADAITTVCDTDAFTSLTLRGNAGPDIIFSMYSAGLLGAPEIYGGQGKDSMFLTTLGTDLSASLIHGGAKTDVAYGDAATIKGCEQINP